MKCLSIMNIRRIGFKKKLTQARPLKDYIDYIGKIKHIDFPVRLKFGLEVCYSPEQEIDIAKIKQMYSFDFLVGSIHFMMDWVQSFEAAMEQE